MRLEGAEASIVSGAGVGVLVPPFSRWGARLSGCGIAVEHKIHCCVHLCSMFVHQLAAKNGPTSLSWPDCEYFFVFFPESVQYITSYIPILRL